MALEPDFSWAELGARIRARRTAQGITQQSLAQAAGLTQNAIFRLEAGETNPQLTTLQGLSAALGTTVRELLCGIPQADSRLGDRFSRVRRVVEAGDEAAIRALDSGLESAEALLERAGGRRGTPSPRKIVAKGEGRRSPIDELLWMTGQVQRTSEVASRTDVTLVPKGGKAFRNAGMGNETTTKNK